MQAHRVEVERLEDNIAQKNTAATAQDAQICSLQKQVSESSIKVLSLSDALDATKATHSLAVQVLICVSCHCIGGFGG